MEVESCRRASHLREELAHDFFAVYGQPLDLDLSILIRYPMPCRVIQSRLQRRPRAPVGVSMGFQRCADCS